MIKDILKSIRAYFGAFQLITKLKLWKYFIIPMIISVLTAVLIGVLSFSLSDNIGNYLASFWKWEQGKQTFSVISTFFSGVLIIAIGLLLYKHIIMALSAPFMSPVSEKIEHHINKNFKHKHRKTKLKEQ